MNRLALAFLALLVGAPAFGATFTPEAMTPPAVCDNATDNTAAFQALGSALQSAGGGVVEMAPGCTYRVFPSPPAGTSGLILLSGIKGLTVNCHGSTLATAYTFPSAGVALYFWQFINSSNITFNDCRFEQINYNVRDGTRGIHALTFTENVHNVVIRNMTVQGANSAVYCTRLPSQLRSSGFTIENLTTVNSYYVINGARCPDNLTAMGVKATNPARSYFVYNVMNHHVQISSNANDGFQDALIGNSYDASDNVVQANFTKGITLNYENTNFPGGNPGGSGVDAYVQIQFGTNEGSADGPAEIEGIFIRANVHRSDGGSPGPLVRISRTAGLTSHGRKISNVVISGGHQTNATSPVVLDLMRDSDWTGEYVRGLTISGFMCNGYGTPVVRVDGRAIAGPFRMESIDGNGVCGFDGQNMTAAKNAGRLNYNQTWLPSLISP